MKDTTSNPTDPKALNIEEALEMAQKLGIALFPINVYKSSRDWASSFSEPAKVWWCALPSSGGVYLPIQEFESEHGEYITTFDTNLYTTQLAETVPEAVLLAAAAIENYERRWKEDQLQREKDRASKHST